MTRLGLLALILLALPAWAQFVEPPLIDDCNRTENPLSNGGQWSNLVLTAHTGPLQATGTTCQGTSASALTSSWWNAATFGPDMAMSATLPDATTTAGAFVRFYLRLSQPGVANQTDGYNCNFLIGETTDTVDFNRLDNSIAAAGLGGCSLSAQVDDGDAVGCRIVGSTLTAWVRNSGVWTQECSASDTTYSAAGYGGMVSNRTNYSIDDIRLGTVSSPATASSLGAVLPFLQ